MGRSLWRQICPDMVMERGELMLAGETVGYTLCDIRVAAHNLEGTRTTGRALRGNLNVYIPGHGQSASAARNILAAIAALSPSGVVWSIDVDPPRGGDRVRAAAFATIVARRLAREFSSWGKPDGMPLRATVFGWSHGASEALLVAEQAPELFEHVVGLCPTGLVARSTVGLLSGFASECFHVVRRGATKGEPALSRTFGIGSHMLAGVARDALRTKSLRRVLNDARWAAQRVTGPHYTCPGTVVLLFANDDRVVRWRDVFPNCRESRDVGRYVEVLREQHFPKVRQFGVRVLEGDHMAPEAHAVAYIDTAFDLVYPQRVSSGRQHLQREQWMGAPLVPTSSQAA